MKPVFSAYMKCTNCNGIIRNGNSEINFFKTPCCSTVLFHPDILFDIDPVYASTFYLFYATLNECISAYGNGKGKSVPSQSRALQYCKCSVYKLSVSE